MEDLLAGGGACLSGFGAAFALSVVVEALTEIFKRLWDKLPTQLVAIVFGVLLALLCNVDLFKLLGFCDTVPYVGCIISGILMSRGSNWLHGLITKATGGGQSAE